MDYIDPRIATVTYRFSRNTKSQSAVDYSDDEGNSSGPASETTQIFVSSRLIFFYLFIFFLLFSLFLYLGTESKFTLGAEFSLRTCTCACERSVPLSCNENFNDKSSAVRARGKGVQNNTIITKTQKKKTLKIQIERHHGTSRR